MTPSSQILLIATTNVYYVSQVYVHCNLIVWDPEGLAEDKKACNYIEQTKR